MANTVLESPILFILLLFVFSGQLEEEQQELEFWRKNQPKENGQGN